MTKKSGANEVEQRSKKSRSTIIIQEEDNNNLNIENDEEIEESEESEEHLSRYFSDENVEEAANNQLSNLERFTNISEDDINQLEIKEGIQHKNEEFDTRLTDVIGKGDWYKPILQSVVLNICAHSKYPSLKELKEGVLSGFHNESRVKNKNAFWSQVRSEVLLSAICKNLDLPRVTSNNIEEWCKDKKVAAAKNFMKRKNNNGENLFEKEIIPDIFKSKDYTPTKSDKLFAVGVIKLAMKGKTVSEENIRQKVGNSKI
ncbi:uncharacterized protein OCT59_028961 [Rhizophagus irregularis]|uniref:Uncharacterized protein n=1 Tax=Rhizophagus irregularis (strain DAOM 197198w) TaxID=1432141 RepID=A0A015J2B7_RHIIW|nr:hypothetical protein RirG_175640 [Rhizophagus irregularis DAOM 197198w]UZO08708.1 hypothetical protein OCT59_028961 [Rhizophagus irregularis]GBC52346.2 hypothetical protein GLOIN_2v1787563 [Rhizophagus irregularis DAOM 181602=DAOM 197198]CAG8559909.1 15233_t:CDS:2 [Rhizophagus irregularis]